MNDAEILAIGALVALVVLAIVGGFVFECHFTRVSWIVAYVVCASSFAIISVAIFFGVTWLEWYLLDSHQATLIAKGTITDVSHFVGKTIYEVSLPDGVWARVVRFEFDPQAVSNTRNGVITGMILGAILLVSRRVAGGYRRGRT